MKTGWLECAGLAVAVVAVVLSRTVFGPRPYECAPHLACDPPEMSPLHAWSIPVLVLGLAIGIGLWLAALLLGVGREE